MPLPTNVSTGTVTGTFVNVAGDPKRGTVTFRPSFTRGLDAGADVVFVPEIVTASLDTQGHFSIQLAATDDPDLAPLNFTYNVEIHIGGVLIPVFSMSLPSGTTKDMTDVIP
jgi:hypothetical protein